MIEELISSSAIDWRIDVSDPKFWLGVSVGVVLILGPFALHLIDRRLSGGKE